LSVLSPPARSTLFPYTTLCRSKIQPETHQRFIDLHSRLNAGDPDSLAKPLGENLADMACEIIDQIFGQMVQIAKSPDSESEKVIQHIIETTRKYMPWSVSLF